MSDSILKKSAGEIVLEATLKQRTASDPLLSSWVGASAGSGKTKVLTDRILRLLLPREDGTPASKPEKILALTFTKAGANEMALRLSKRLSDWAVMGDAALAKDMEENLFGRAPRPEETQAARKLFARVVDTPGGLNIMTIHSFCQSVLGRFPIEAGLPPNFTPLEEDQASKYLAQAKAEILILAAKEKSSPLGLAIGNISTLMNEEQFDALMKNIIGERHQIKEILRKTFGIDGLYTKLCQLFAIPPGIGEDHALAIFCKPDFDIEGGLREACHYLAEGTAAGDQKRAWKIQAFLDADEASRPSLYDQYQSAFITGGGTVVKSLATKGVLAKAPHIEQVLIDEANRILSYEDTRKRIVCASATRDLFLLGHLIQERYQQIKESLGVLDFDDLILYTLSLFKGDLFKDKKLEMASWVLYKMDEGLEHILVDEAQDTNPEQWEIVKILSTEFFAGQGAKDVVRTVFVVGDDKQSIFSFQRADPKKYHEMYRWFDKIIRESGNTFMPVDINTSFRSVQIVLDAVDAIFNGTLAGKGLAEKYLSHIAKRERQAGTVEIWPVYRTSTDETDEENSEDIAKAAGSWFMPDKITESESGSLKMANKIGDTIKKWIGKEDLHSYNRKIQAGDILILVRSRNAFVGQLVRVLKKNGIPVSGIDRMVLVDQLAVQDLSAAARFALLPEDDFTLGCLLKSPFIGYDEDRLYALAQDRPSTLWESLKQSRDMAVLIWLENLISQAGKDHPYEFFSRILQEPCPASNVSGLHAIRRRLGEDALDALDEFLNTTLSYETSHTAGLQGFLQWHTDGSSDIKRQLEEGGNAVRIMTVHASKGLQAPIVFLPDTIRSTSSIKPDKIFWPHKTNVDVPVYIHSKSDIFPTVSPAQKLIEAKMDEEYRRLLYVAMTRAEERLYIGGYINKKEPGNIAYWYDDVRSAMQTLGERIERIASGVADKNGQDIPILRMQTERTAPPDKMPKTQKSAPKTEVQLEPWVFVPAPDEPVPPRPLTPSRPSESEPAAASPLALTQAYRFKRGTITHKLMQTLPNLPLARRRAAAEKFLARAALGLPPDLQKDIATEIMAILEDPQFGEIFGPQSMAEVAISGLLNGISMVSGQIDRILIRENDILVVDYKTNRPPPQKTQDVPQIYVRQMKAYADTLRTIYPRHKIRCALLWTDGARLMEIDV